MTLLMLFAAFAGLLYAAIGGVFWFFGPDDRSRRDKLVETLFWPLIIYIGYNNHSDQ